MSKKAFTKKNMILIISTILISVIGSLSYMVFWNSSTSYPVPKVSTALISKIDKVSTAGTPMELSNEDLNAILGMYFKEEKTFGKITIKEVHSEILKDSIKLNIPISYKDLNFMLTSEGKLEVKDKVIIYSPSNFKVGKISLPKAYILKILQRHLVKGIDIKDNNIVLDKNILPLEIKTIEVKNDRLYVGIENASGSMEKKIIASYKKLKDKLWTKSYGDANNTSNNTSNTDLKDVSSNTSNSNNSNIGNESDSESNNESSNNNSSETESNGINKEVQNSSERQQALSRINGDLSSAMSSVSTGGQRAVIGQMISVVNTMAGNPSYDPYSASGSIRASYKSLSAKEKAELKAAIFSNVDTGSINVVMSMIGM